MTPTEVLLVAILGLAWRDAHGKNPQQRAEALAWLESPGADYICESLGLDVGKLRAGCHKLPMGKGGPK